MRRRMSTEVSPRWNLGTAAGRGDPQAQAALQAIMEAMRVPAPTGGR